MQHAEGRRNPSCGGCSRRKAREVADCLQFQPRPALPLGNGNQALTKGTNTSLGLEEAANRKNQAVESTNRCSVKTAFCEEPEIYEPREITDHVEISDLR
jgi:hypothetical protein